MSQFFCPDNWSYQTVTKNCLVTNIIQSIFSHVSQKKVSHTSMGRVKHEGEKMMTEFKLLGELSLHLFFILAVPIAYNNE